MSDNILNIATACLLDDAGRLLVVRKRGARYFMLPGGKAEPGETSVGTLIRELDEELALTIDESRLQYLGHFEARAANEPDHWVKAEVFVARLAEPVENQAEIEELGWLAIDGGDSQRLAPLLCEEVLPALRRHLSNQLSQEPRQRTQGDMGSLAGKVSSNASSS